MRCSRLCRYVDAENVADAVAGTSASRMPASTTAVSFAFSGFSLPLGRSVAGDARARIPAWGRLLQGLYRINTALTDPNIMQRVRGTNGAQRPVAATAADT